MMVKVRVDPATPEQGDGGGVSTTARTPPVARAAATSAIITISLVLNDTTLMGSSRLSLKGPWPIWCGADSRMDRTGFDSAVFFEVMGRSLLRWCGRCRVG